MPINNIEERRAYHRAYNKKYKQAHKGNMDCFSLVILHADTDKVLQSIPNPFGSFEKAKYVIYRKRSVIPSYSFITTCRNTEDCIEIMKDKFKQRNAYRDDGTKKRCSIFKIQNGIKKLIFREMV